MAMASIGLGTGTIISATSFEDESLFTIRLTTATEVARRAATCIVLGEEVPPGQPSALALKFFIPHIEPLVKQNFLRELKAVKRLGDRHPNILSFIGVASHKGIQDRIHMVLIAPYMKNGNMMAYLTSNPSVPRLPLILQVASAVEHLHLNCGLVHGDLKCENVLISDDLRPLLADFGLCTAVEKSEFSEVTASSVRGLFSVHFAAPEVLFDSARSPSGLLRSKTTESDVYAFDMLVLQAFSECLPWGDYSNFQVTSHVLNLAEHPHPGYATYSKGFGDRFWEICRSCWKTIKDGQSYSGLARPTITEVYTMLKVLSFPSPYHFRTHNLLQDISLNDAENGRDSSASHPSAGESLGGVQCGTVLKARSLRRGSPFTLTITSIIPGAPYSQKTMCLGQAKLSQGNNICFVAKIYQADHSASQREMLWRELQVSRTVSHAHVLPIFGEAQWGNHTVLCTPFMQNGHVMSYLHKNPTLNPRALILQVANAVEYLHTNARVSHGDLRCENVMVSDAGRAQLINFSRSTFHAISDKTVIDDRVENALRFFAPEVFLEGKLNGSSAMHADVYAFGMVILQVLHLWFPTVELPN
ncbi:kinase-like protein [Auricularia subglabra TFB-10046 SS5]|nr:kinase-like protein [Auricularia subglabra TFB-10046 SS5]